MGLGCDFSAFFSAVTEKLTSIVYPWPGQTGFGEEGAMAESFTSPIDAITAHFC
jgi:hypothetical protein